MELPWKTMVGLARFLPGLAPPHAPHSAQVSRRERGLAPSPDRDLACPTGQPSLVQVVTSTDTVTGVRPGSAATDAASPSRVRCRACGPMPTSVVTAVRSSSSRSR